MKLTLICILFLTAAYCNAQVKLEKKDLTNLIAIAELYSQNPNARGDDFAKSINSLRTPKLGHIADALILVGKGDKTILEDRYLARPSDDELVMWYVIREIHYNRTSETKTNKTSVEVATEVLSKKIDSRWLLDNYYYRIHGGIALLFNTADLSKVDIKVDSLGFKDETERAIFFLNIMDALVGGRFKVLLVMKNHQKILEFTDKLPKFNGKDYFRYTSFNYDDFDWIGYEKTESYNHRNLGDFYVALLAHYFAADSLKGGDASREIYINSILSQPKYFKFSEASETLQKMYDSSK